MLAETVALKDIKDVEGFVHRTINRANLSLSKDEREELVLEGIAILYRLADIYQPHREGHTQNIGRFSGFAAQFLPRKLGDAWHRMHPEHRLVTDPETGKRRWAYLDKPTSYEHVVLAGIDGDRPTVLEHQVRTRAENWTPPVAVLTRARRRNAPAGTRPAEAAA